MKYRRLHVEAVGGVAGDMMLGALLDLGAPLQSLRDLFLSLGLPGLSLDVSRVTLDQVQATYVRSLGPNEGHVHRHLSEVFAVIDRAALSPAARTRARNIFSVLAEAEAVVHGSEIDHVALHEVGEIDSILDVVGIAAALDFLGNPIMTAAALPSGRGPISTRHGVLSCPVPAVQHVAQTFNIPLKAVPIPSETITPTGIAVLAVCCERFGDKPADTPTRVGIGAGTRRFTECPNIVRILGYV